MSALSELEPKERCRVIDLVHDAGVDVSDWGNFKGGKKKAASNPKYCYAWSFVQPNKVVVLCLWYARMREQDGVIFRVINYQEFARKSARDSKNAVNTEAAIRTAMDERLPIRVVVCDGEMRDRNDPEAKASRVKKRLLDRIPWAVTKCDRDTGEYTLTRGALPSRFVDQFSVQDELPSAPERLPVRSLAFARDPKIRTIALVRANGKCEFCEQPGFRMANGSVFLETHHVHPLAEGGLDIEENVVALCPNHHREAHYGASSPEMRKRLLALLRGRSR